jgi:hypothetical protein
MSKLAKAADIQAIKLVMRAYEDKEALLTMQCKKYKLTPEFMQEFGPFITKQSFSSSPDLDFELMKLYEEYFDKDIWIDSREKSLDPLLEPNFVAVIGADNIDTAIKNTDPKRVSIEVFEAFEGIIPYDVKVQIINQSRLVENEEIMIKYAEYLTSDIFRNRSIDVKWTEDLIEKIFANKTLTVKFVFAALTNVRNLFFIEKVLRDKTLKYQPTNDTFNIELKNFINKISENQIGDLFDILRTNNPAAFTYDTLSHVLKMKDYLSEQFLMENLELFLQNALFDEVVKYARFKDYMDLLVLLKFNDVGRDEED